MTPKERAAMQQALIYLDAIINGEGVKPYQLEGTAFTLREVLAEQAVPSQLADASLEPVGRWNWNEAKFEWLTKFDYHKHHMTPLYAAPVQQAEQEPVAWIKLNEDGVYIEDVTGFPVYAAPVHTKDLTDDEIMKINVDTAGIVPTCDRQFHFARAVIAADREKNK